MKFKLIAMPAGRSLAAGAIERIGEEEASGHIRTDAGALERPVAAADHYAAVGEVAALLTDPDRGALDEFGVVDAFGHRVVHGGEKLAESVRIDDGVLAEIRRCAEFAPLHNLPNLTGIEAAGRFAPGKPQVACFDTAFHQTLPPHAYRYALPERFYAEMGIRRYGFHGTSHQYVSRTAAERTGRDPRESRWITCHLGNGCSVAAVRDGRCVDTSMGFTPLEGLVMGTRSGDLDPAILVHLGRLGWSFDDLDRLLNRESGLLGLSGNSNDMRELEELGAKGDPAAKLAIDVFAHRVRKFIGAFLAVLGGCDGIVFTGGIGEHGAAVRERIVTGLDGIGIVLDRRRNEAPGGDGRISADESPVDLLVVPTDEEGEIARETYRVASGKVSTSG